MAIDASSVTSALTSTTAELARGFGLSAACFLVGLYFLLRYPLRGKEEEGHRRAHLAGALVILGIMFAQGLVLTGEDSPTYDEPNHVASGYSYLRTGDFRMSLAQPPVGRMFLALPLLVTRPVLPLQNESWRKADDWTFAREFLFHSGNDADRIMFWSRFQALLLWGVLGFAVFAWSRQLFGWRGGYFSLLLYAFSPNFLAHGRLATTEMPFACFAFVSAYFFWKLLERPRVRNVILAGIFLGLALSAKYSGLILIFSFLISAGVWSYGRRSPRDGATGVTRPGDSGPRVSAAGWSARPVGSADSGAPRRRGAGSVRSALALCVVVLVIGGVIAFLSSGPSAKPVLDYPAVQAKLEAFGEKGVFVFESEKTGRLAQRLASSLPLPRYVVGVLFNHFHFKRGHLAYFAGEWKSGGWWYYFPAAFLLKVPLPLLVLMLLGLALRLGSRSPLSSAETILVCVPIVSLLWSMGFVRLNIGFRHILFVLPFIHVLLGHLVKTAPDGVRTRSRTLKRLVPGVLLVWYCLASISISPHHLAYFNELAGGPRGGVNWLVDSNLDWGQDLKRLKTHVEEERVDSLKLLYFGTAEPSYYDIRFEPLTLRDFEDLCVSDLAGTSGAGELSGADAHYANQKWAVSATSYAALLRHAPWLRKIQGHEDTRIGYSILVFDPSRLKSALRSSAGSRD